MCKFAGYYSDFGDFHTSLKAADFKTWTCPPMHAAGGDSVNRHLNWTDNISCSFLPLLSSAVHPDNEPRGEYVECGQKRNHWGKERGRCGQWWSCISINQLSRGSLGVDILLQDWLFLRKGRRFYPHFKLNWGFDGLGIGIEVTNYIHLSEAESRAEANAIEWFRILKYVVCKTPEGNQFLHHVLPQGLKPKMLLLRPPCWHGWNQNLPNFGQFLPCPVETSLS